MTTYVKVGDLSTTYTDVSDASGLGYTEVSDAETTWGGLDFMLYLCTEGERKFIMTEGEETYIIVQRGIDKIDYVSVEDDSSTIYIKVLDA